MGLTFPGFSPISHRTLGRWPNEPKDVPTWLCTFRTRAHPRGDLHNCLLYFPPKYILLDLTSRNERTKRPPASSLTEGWITSLLKFPRTSLPRNNDDDYRASSITTLFNCSLTSNAMSERMTKMVKKKKKKNDRFIISLRNFIDKVYLYCTFGRFDVWTSWNAENDLQLLCEIL